MHVEIRYENNAKDRPATYRSSGNDINFEIVENSILKMQVEGYESYGAGSPHATMPNVGFDGKKKAEIFLSKSELNLLLNFLLDNNMIKISID